jgi:hypothetical protein
MTFEEFNFSYAIIITILCFSTRTCDDQVHNGKAFESWGDIYRCENVTKLIEKEKVK